MIKYAVIEILSNISGIYIDVDKVFDNFEDANEYRTYMLKEFNAPMSEDLDIIPFNYQILQYMDAE